MLQARLKQLVKDDSAKDDQTGMLTQPTIIHEFVSVRTAPGLPASALQLPLSLLADQTGHKYQILVYKARVLQGRALGLRLRTAMQDKSRAPCADVFSCESQLVRYDYTCDSRLSYLVNPPGDKRPAYLAPL